MSTTRRNIMLGTAGHVDHGKTALVKILTGCDTDTLEEEKRRGLTIDLGFAPCRLAGGRVVGVVDVPGHVDFIRNMVAGAQGIDVVILVVAADDGIMPQTLEHLRIVELMGIQHGVVALTKVDLVDPARCASVAEDLRRLLGGTFLRNAPVCPLSNVTGEGFEAFFDALNTVVAECRDRPAEGLFRMWVEDAFSIRGAGTVVTGIPVSGGVSPGEELTLLPQGLRARVRRLQVYGEDATRARAGECTALNLPELDHEQARRGQVLGDATIPAATCLAEARLSLLRELTGGLKDGVEVHLHVGTAAVLARVSMLERFEMAPGEAQMVQLKLAQALPVAPGDRFVVRSSAGGASGPLSTVGGGVVLGCGGTRLKRRRSWVIDRLTARFLALGDAGRWAEQMLREAAGPAAPVRLSRECMRSAKETEFLLGELEKSGAAVRVSNGEWVHEGVVAAAARALLDTLKAYHDQHPEQAGIGRDALRTSCPNAKVFEAAMNRLTASGQVRMSGTVVALGGWKPRVGGSEQERCDQLAALFREAGWAPPDLETAAARMGESPGRIQRLALLLIGQGTLVEVGPGVIVHREAVERAAGVAVNLFRKAPMFTTMEFRDALGVSRKFAVPLLDHLDRLRFTVRSGHNRTPGVESRKRLT